MSDKILVTGAGGYIGRHVVDVLISMGIPVTACDINITGINKKADIIAYDIFSGDPHIFNKLGSPGVCIHLAWKNGFVHQADSHMQELSKHYTFVKDIIDSGLRHLSVMGTVHEVGYHVGAVDENTPCNPVSMYGIAKDALRRSVMLMLKDKGVVLQWLRAFYIYGDDEKNNSIFTKIIQAEKAGQKTFPFNTGKNKYDFIPVDKLARLIAISSVQDNVTGIINCCTGQPVSLAEKVESFIKEHAFHIKLEYGAFPDRSYDSPEIWGDNTKISDVISNCKEKIDLC